MKKIKCLICGKEVTNNGSYIGSHVKRVHNLTLNNYVKKHYINLTSNFKLEKCGFCNNYAIPNFKIDHVNKTYELDYKNGYFCHTAQCKENISQKIFNKPYDKKKFEHIGANSLYLSLLYKKNIADVKYDKSKGFRELIWRCNLENYVKKYGKEEGIKRYEERNVKISKANTLSWYIEKYGDIEGLEKYDIFRKKKHKAFGPNKSIKSKIVSNILDKQGIYYIEEYKYQNEIGKNGAIDFFIPDLNIVIEFYGDYWHCNPKYYPKSYFHKIMKRFAYEIWQKDKKRISYIFNKEFNKKVAILIIWESTILNEKYFLTLLNQIKQSNQIIEI
jgi:G:T-mismatch repair DNA endonuclease (very short patch repair protein)